MSERAMAMDEGKIKYSLTPASWIRIITMPFVAGIAKGYPENNWMQSVNTDEHDSFRERRLNSALRHLQAYREGQWIDPETKLPHLALAAWNLLCVWWYDDNDKRPKPGAIYPGGFNYVG